MFRILAIIVWLTTGYMTYHESWWRWFGFDGSSACGLVVKGPWEVFALLTIWLATSLFKGLGAYWKKFLSAQQRFDALGATIDLSNLEIGDKEADDPRRVELEVEIEEMQEKRGELARQMSDLLHVRPARLAISRFISPWLPLLTEVFLACGALGSFIAQRSQMKIMWISFRDPIAEAFDPANWPMLTTQRISILFVVLMVLYPLWFLLRSGFAGVEQRNDQALFDKKRRYLRFTPEGKLSPRSLKVLREEVEVLSRMTARKADPSVMRAVIDAPRTEAPPMKAST
jgi:hypothetical protein